MSKTSKSIPKNLKKSLHFQRGFSGEEECIGVYNLDVMERLVEDSNSVQNHSRVHALELVSSNKPISFHSSTSCSL